jgi:hypothetical protein
MNARMRGLLETARKAKRRRRRKVAAPLRLALIVALVSGAPAFGQSCPRGEPNIAELNAKVAQAARQFRQYLPNDPDNSGPPPDSTIIYRAAAVGGKAMIPALRRIAKPGMDPETVPGEAQVALAKLGDHAAFDEIAHELEWREGNGTAAQKLGQVGSLEAVRVLLKYFYAHAADPDRFQTHGDYGSDSMRGVVEALASFVRNPPSFGGSVSDDAKDWAAWWDQNKSNPLAFSFSGSLRNPFLQCLARKVDWGFPEAILDLGTAGKPEAIAALKTLTQLGDQRVRASGIETIRGRAQAALAKLGDAGEFQAIVRELESPGSDDAVRKMQYIGGRRAAEAMLESLNGAKFLDDYPDWKYDGKNAPGIVFDHDEAIENTLIKMVVSPPDRTGEQRNKGKWLAWWAQNKNTARFAPPPVAMHE